MAVTVAHEDEIPRGEGNHLSVDMMLTGARFDQEHLVVIVGVPVERSGGIDSGSGEVERRARGMNSARRRWRMFFGGAVGAAGGASGRCQ